MKKRPFQLVIKARSQANKKIRFSKYKRRKKERRDKKTSINDWEETKQ